MLVFFLDQSYLFLPYLFFFHLLNAENYVTVLVCFRT